MAVAAIQAVEFLGLACQMERVPNKIRKGDLEAFMQQLLDYKLKQVAYTEKRHEQLANRRIVPNIQQLASLKREVIASLYRLNLLSRNLLGKFPSGLTSRAARALVNTPGAVKNLLHTDIENRFKHGTLYRDIMSLS